MLASAPTLHALSQRLARVQQEHVLKFHDSLSAPERSTLLASVASIDWENLPALIATYVTSKPAYKKPARLEPVKAYPLAGPWDRASAKRRGEDLIRRGKVGAFVVAGGQGSRLGFEGPKGCFPAGCVTGKSLFAMFAEGLLGAQDRYGKGDLVIPWYIMTSPLNHAQTAEFFEAHKFFGLRREQVMFFQQGVLPSFDMASGKVLLASKSEVATNPDGHGGSIRALQQSGALRDMKTRGIEHLSYFQVDNPLVRIIDPLFLGLHAGAHDSSAEMSSKVVAKASPDEKVGVFCLADGRTGVLEYSDMPADLQNARREDGKLLYNEGNIAIHALGVAFIERLATDPASALPCHRAEKKVAHIDLGTGNLVTPTTNNAVKLERFIFDALAVCRGSLVMETSRAEEFAPIKNATGVDSVESSKQLQTARAAAWLEQAGVGVPKDAAGDPDCTIEISPRTASCAEDLAGASLPLSIERGQSLAL